jgi:hypothetical protein
MIKKTSLLLASLMLVTGCTTTGTFKVPEGAKLYVHKRPVPLTIQANGKAESKPFFWTAAGTPESGGGISYRLEKDGQTIKEGKLRTKFRPVSIFWPPVYGLIAWPFGFNPNITYDLVNDKQE